MRNKVLSSTSTNKEKRARLRQLIQTISNSRESNFYKNIWKNTPLKNGVIDFENTSTIEIGDIIKYKFNKRLYVKNGLFVKIIYHNNIPFLIARTKRDISKDNYGEINYERPLVFFESSHESIEKALWLYNKNILPLMAEDNIDLTEIIAGRYEIDSIIGDVKSITNIISRKTGRFDIKKIKNVTIIDSFFDKNFISILKNYLPSGKIQIILSLPETGPLGLLCKKTDKENLTFHPPKNTIIETSKNGYLIATRLILLPTPIIKYETEIKIRMAKKFCSCKKSNLNFSIQK